MSQKKEQLTRVGVSIELSLMEKFDRMIEKKGYTNRSEAFRDILRDILAAGEAERGKEMVGAILIVLT